MATDLIVGFNGGEVSRNIESRVDLPLYRRSCSILENGDVLPEGGVRNRAGLKYITGTKNDTSARLIDFSYSDEYSYMLEFGEQYVRVYNNQTESLVADLTTPYALADVDTLQFERSYDVMWLVHPNYPEQTLSRTSVATFTFAETVYDFPPMLDQNATSTTVTASATTGSGITLTSSAPIWTEDHVGAYWLIQHEKTGASSSFTEASLNGTSATSFDVSFSNWRIETSGAGITGKVTVERNINGSGWETYIIVGDSTGIGSKNFVYDSEIREGANTLIRVKTTALLSSYTLYNNEIFTYGLVKITGFTSSTEVTADVISDLESTVATAVWSEGAFSVERGYPRTIALFEERRFLSGTDYEPNMVWGSFTNDYYNYFVGTLDDEGIRRAPPVNGFSAFLAAKENLFLATTNELITITGLVSSKGLTPSNFKFNIQSSFGAQYEQNELANDIILYVQKGRGKVREIIYSDEERNFRSQDLSALAKHITKRGIGTTALQRLPEQRLYCILDDGQVGVLTYERTEEVVAWQRYITEGTFHSVAVTINGDEDTPWFVVERENGFFLEKLVSRDDAQTDYEFLDSFVDYNLKTGTAQIIDGVVVDAGEESEETGVASTNVQIVPEESGYLLVSNGTSGGTEYINTGINPNGHFSRYIIEYKHTSLGGPIGVGSATDRLYLISAVDANFTSRYNSEYVDLGVPRDSLLHKFEYVASTGKFYIDDIETSNAPSGGICNASGDIFLFAWNVSGAPNNLQAGKLKSFKYYNNETLLQDLTPVPVGDTTFSVIPAPSNCMYDKVSGTYFENQGTGNFTIEAL